MSRPRGRFHDFVERASAARRLVVQPRMGFADPAEMRRGLLAVRDAAATTVGTVTLDSYTRVGDLAAVDRALVDGSPLNGYPIVTFGADITRGMLDGVLADGFPVQVRHGSANPGRIIDAVMACGLDATEGGPVSYCLPYNRTPLRDAVRDWAAACRRFAGLRDRGIEPHLETFGGCMLGQLCPPGMLVAIAVLEGMFFARHGLRSVSLSYAQQTSPAQDAEAIAALRALAAEFLPAVSWHVVLYAYMGLYPGTAAGALGLVADAARLAARTGCARLIVKTAAEADRIPTIGENVTALETAALAAAGTGRDAARPADTGIAAEARALIEGVLALDPDIGQGLVAAFATGRLDVPYCLHPDNAGRTRTAITPDGRLVWARTGSLPIAPAGEAADGQLTSAGLLRALSYVQRRYDRVPASR